MKQYLFYIRKSDNDNSSTSWMRLITLFNDVLGTELWSMEVVYGGKLVVLVNLKWPLTIAAYVSTFNTIAHAGLINKDFDYEEKK